MALPSAGAATGRSGGARRPWRATGRAVLAAIVAFAMPMAVVWPASADLVGHGGPVRGIAVSADGRLALTASFDYSAILWDLDRQAVLHRLQGHDAAVNAVAFVPGTELAVSGSDDRTVAIWSLATGTLERRLAGHEAKVTAVAVSPDGRLVASAGWDRAVRLWRLSDPSAGRTAPRQHPERRRLPVRRRHCRQRRPRRRAASLAHRRRHPGGTPRRA